ncbi:hyaluronan mediated motility receptor-like [Anoplophora glabripennis]|uniref:hyaluronan mediated motility receptor-like n=1 Tax=Anoplophora glabripennis TaxID=217634 RepID=UPI000875841A|nr:hyaluronan mediated motility receptor-like [Anoplophora glabripennis]
MSFSKAKIQRFNDIKPIAPGPTAYNVLIKDRPKISVASQSDRIAELRSPSVSESGSTHSVPCRFRTPILPKKKKTTTSDTKSKNLFAEHVESEALKEKIVECENKDASIKSLTEEIEILKNNISNLEEQKKQLDVEKQKVEECVVNLKTDHKNEIKKLQETFEDDIKKVVDEKTKVNDEIVLAKKQYELLKEANRKEMNELKNNCDKFNILYNKSFEECNKLVEEKNLLLTNKERELKDLEGNFIELQRKHSMEIEKLRKAHQMEIQDIEFEILKTMTELQKQKEEASRKIDELESAMQKTVADLKWKFEQEQEQLILEYEDKIKKITDQVMEAEKSRMREQLYEMESNWRIKFENQQQQSNAILQECQTISEYNIIQCELEKKEIETKLMEKTKELEANLLQYSEVISNYEDLKKKYNSLQHEFSSSVTGLKQTNDTLSNELRNKTNEIKKYLEENRTYLVTIKSSQNTIEVIKKRLIDSDRDVEQLKKEVSENEARLLEYENKCMQLASALKQAQDYNEELEMQHESAIKLNTSEIQQLKAELWQKVKTYRKEVEKKLIESEETKKEIMQQLHKAHEVIEILKTEFKCFDTTNCQYEFEVEQSRNELEDYRIREMDWSNLKEKLEHNVRELEDLLEMKQDEVNDFKKQVAHLQDKCESYFHHSEYCKNKVLEYEKELEDAGNIHKKYIELSGKYDELLQKFQQLERENLENQKEILRISKNCQEKENYMEKTVEHQLLRNRLKQTELEKDTLLGRIQFLENELKKVSDKYADLAGHTNNKQKIKHVVDLKAKNEELVKANMDLELKVQSQLKVMEKLKKENTDLKKCLRKTKLHPEDKENINSPNRSLNSSRVESPFRERN